MGEAKRKGSREQRIAMARQRDAADLSIRQSAGDFLRQGITLEADVLKHSEAIREQAKQNYEQQWIDGRLILLSIVQHLMKAKERVPGKTSEQISHVLILLMAFFQGTHITEGLVSEGQYIKAAAALKQDYEIIARISEVRAGTARPGQTPQVRHLADEVKAYYGELNKIAHPSNQEILVDLMRSLSEGESQGISHIPRYNGETAKGLYELHLWLILMAAKEYMLLFIEMYGEGDQAISEVARWFLAAKDLLEQVGFKFQSETKAPE
ncbi:MAG: hypothetical protein ACXWC4_03305 [Telluria sp.]